MATNDVYRLTLRTAYFGRLNYNIFHYVQATNGVGVAAQQLWNGFQADVWPHIAAVLSSDVDTPYVQVVSYPNPTTDNYESAPTPGTGSLSPSAQMIPRWVLSMRSSFGGPTTRRSYKRFSGIVEQMVAGDAVDAAYATAVGTLANALGDTIGGGGATFTPCQVPSNSEYGVNPTINRLVTDWSFAGWATQNSRSIN